MILRELIIDDQRDVTDAVLSIATPPFSYQVVVMFSADMHIEGPFVWPEGSEIVVV